MPIDRTEKRALYLVNEYGEFSELMQVARLLKKETDLGGLFVFARDDYGRLEEHRTIAKGAGFDAISLSGLELASLKWSEKGEGLTDFGNLPDNGRAGGDWLQRIKSFLFVAPMYVGLVLLAIPATLLLMLLVPVAMLAHFVRRKGKSRFDAYKALPAIGRYAVEFARLPREWLRLRRWKRHARQLLAFHDPDIVIMGQDYPGSYNTAVTKYAVRRGIKSVIVPFGMYTARELAESFYYYEHHVLPGGIVGSVFRWLFPSWVFKYRGRNLLRLPMSEMLAVILHGLGPATPWRPQSGPTHLLSQSRQAHEYYSALEKPEALMRLTGSVWNDIVAENLAGRSGDRELRRQVVDKLRHLERLQRQLSKAGVAVSEVPRRSIGRMAPAEALALLEGLGRDIVGKANEVRGKLANKVGGDFAELLDVEVVSRPDRQIVIVAWPANQYPARPAPGIKDYEALTKGLIDSLSLLVASKKFDVWVSLHPTLYGVVDEAAFEAAELKIVNWPLIDFLHCADFFIATVSSTLIWAVQSRIPSVNFDCYVYGYPEFAKMGCAEATTFGALDRILHGMIAEPGRVWPAEEESTRLANYWGFPEGGSRRRIVAGISDLMRS